MNTSKKASGQKASSKQADAVTKGAKRPMPKAERRVQLLKVAYQIIAEDGVAALNMSTLADRAGAAKPIVYEHFKNAQEVIFHILDDYFQNMSNYVLEHNSGLENIHDFFDKSIDAMVEFHIKEKFNLKRITNGFSMYEKTDNLFYKYNQRSVSFYRIILEQQGVERKDSEIPANILHELILGTVNNYAGKRNVNTAKAMLKQAVASFINTLIKPTGQKPVAPTEVLKLHS